MLMIHIMLYIISSVFIQLQLEVCTLRPTFSISNILMLQVTILTKSDLFKIIKYTSTNVGQAQDGLSPASSVGVLDFVQERFHNTSLGDFENMFIKTVVSEAKEGLRVEEVTRA